MSQFEQVPYIDTTFADTEFAENPAPRCPVILLLDTSGSMSGNPIRELNQGLISFKEEIMNDSMARKRVEVAVIHFGPVSISNEFVTVEEYTPSQLSASGGTPMGQAIETALDLLKTRKESYKRNAIPYYRPWIFLITDGGPTDNWKNAAHLVHQGEESKAFMFYAVGIQGADFNVLRQISARDPLALKELRFRDLFAWLSSSLKSVSQSNPGELVPLSNPTAPNGWGTVI